MPNHVENDLYVRGDKATLEAFIAFAKEPAGCSEDREDGDEVLLSAEKFVPIPPEFLSTDFICTKCGYNAGKKMLDCPTCKVGCMDGYNRGGYEWCLENWGTKWGLYDVEKVDDGNMEEGPLVYFFLTAWSPPLPVILAMSVKFPTLEFDLDYFEAGMGFMGSCEFKGGVVVKAGDAPYHGPRGG